MKAIEFWYEFASTYSYPAAMRIDAVAEHQGIAVRWRPFLLGPVFADLGWSTSPFNLQPAKGAYMWRDLERTCQRLELPFVRPHPFPQNGLTAARAAWVLRDDGARARFSRAVFRAEFGEGTAIHDEAVLAQVLKREGFDAQRVLECASDPDTKQALRESTAQAMAHGIFGAPTYRTQGGELFWGNDRLAEAIEWAKDEVA